MSFFTKQQLENYHICGFGKQNEISNLLYLIHWCAHQSSCIFLRQHPKAMLGNCKLVTTVHMVFFFKRRFCHCLSPPLLRYKQDDLPAVSLKSSVWSVTYTTNNKMIKTLNLETKENYNFSDCI